MGYSLRQEVIQALANALSQGSPNAPGTLVDLVTVGKLVSDTISDAELYQYISWADQQIDAAIVNIYQTPLQRVNLGSFEIANDITAGDLQVIMPDTTRFTIGDVILVRDSTSGQFQQLTIQDIPNENTLLFTTPIINSYSALTTKIERIRYPDPIPLVSARLAAAYMYDKHFAAQVEGNESDYGKYLRQHAFQALENVLLGVERLKIADAGKYVGRRYYNHALDDVIATKSKPEGGFFRTQ